MPAARPRGGLDREIERITQTVHERDGSVPRRELQPAVGTPHRGPGRLHTAVRAALRQGRLRRVGATRRASEERF